MTRSPRFTRELWKHIGGIFEAILAHPFIQGLTDGSLPRTSFRFYVVQDALYLREFARALSIAAAKAPEDGDIAMFNAHAAEAIQVERQLHEGFFKAFRLSPRGVRDTPMAPTTRAYTSYLLSVSYGRPFHEGLAALLPCYWIYGEVGKTLAKRGSPDELYRRWIDTYGTEEFGEVVRAVVSLTDRVAGGLSEEEREAMIEHFVATSRYEWMFWDMGYRREGWPV